MTAVSAIIYPVTDLGHARSIYSTLLGVEPYTDAPYYVGFQVGKQDIGLDPNGHQHGMTGPVCFVEVADIHTHLQALLDAGATLVQGVRNVGGGRQIASVKDRDGNQLGLMQNS